MSTSPNNPYPAIPEFFDVPGVNIPLQYATTSSVKLPSKVSNEATQRIGMVQQIITKSNTSYALTGSDGANLGFGGRVGAVTVFGTDNNPGSDTQAVDSRRQGVSVRTIDQFDKLIVPLIRATDEPLNNRLPFIDFNSRIEAYGQPKLFNDPKYDSAEHAFTDIFAFNPVTFIKLGGYYYAYPMIMDLPNYRDPDQMNGIIEVFDVRNTFSNTSIIDYPFMKGAHGDLGGGYLKNKKGTAVISSKFEVVPPQAIDCFEDAEDVYFPGADFVTGSYTAPGLRLRKFAVPGIISECEYVLPAYNDAVDYTTGSYDEFSSTILSHVTTNQQVLYNLNNVWHGSTSPFYKYDPIPQLPFAPSSDLRAWWRLDKDVSAAGTVLDSSAGGAGLALTAPSAAERPAFDASDRPSQYISTINGTCKFISNDVLHALDSDKFTFSDLGKDTPFSLSSWVKLDPSSASVRYIVSKWNSTTPAQEWTMYVRANNTPGILVYDQGKTKFARARSSLVLPDLEWCHIVATYDGSAKSAAGTSLFNGLKLYVNGAELLSSEYIYTTEATYTNMVNTAAKVAVGNMDNFSTVYDFEGNIAEVAIYSVELTGIQVAALYDGGKNGPYYQSFSTISQMLNSGSVGPYSKMSEIGTRFKSANCGLQFGESNVLGTDSIAFGGFRK